MSSTSQTKNERDESRELAIYVDGTGGNGEEGPRELEGATTPCSLPQ